MRRRSRAGSAARRGRARTALVLLAWAAASRAADAPTMPEELKAQLRSETFAERASVAALPAPVREGLAVLFRSPGLEMADPGEPFQVTDVVVGRILPARRLGVAGCSPRHCVVYYERGGIAHTWSAVVFDAGGAPARFLWGGSAPRGLAGVEAVRRALLDGSVTGRSDYW